MPSRQTDIVSLYIYIADLKIVRDKSRSRYIWIRYCRIVCVWDHGMATTTRCDIAPQPPPHGMKTRVLIQSHGPCVLSRGQNHRCCKMFGSIFMGHHISDFNRKQMHPFYGSASMPQSEHLQEFRRISSQNRGVFQLAIRFWEE
jgi:hypothetical protein